MWSRKSLADRSIQKAPIEEEVRAITLERAAGESLPVAANLYLNAAQVALMVRADHVRAILLAEKAANIYAKYIESDGRKGSGDIDAKDANCQIFADRIKDMRRSIYASMHRDIEI